MGVGLFDPAAPAQLEGPFSHVIAKRKV